MAVRMQADDIMAFVDRVFEQVRGDFAIEEIGDETMRVRMNVSERHLRPGGTVSGPAMFALADVSAYFLTLAHIGPQELTVTTSCSIDFMRKPVAGVDLIAQARLLKLGRTLSVTDVLLFSQGTSKPVARATLTYSIPPVKS